MNADKPATDAFPLEKIQQKAPDAAADVTLAKKEEDSLANQRTRTELAGLLQDIRQRKEYAGKIFCLISLWLIAIFLILVACGIDCLKFRLSDNVLLALIGGTTVNVLGLFLVVANYLFYRPK